MFSEGRTYHGPPLMVPSPLAWGPTSRPRPQTFPLVICIWGWVLGLLDLGTGGEFDRPVPAGLGYGESEQVGVGAQPRSGSAGAER